MALSKNVAGQKIAVFAYDTANEVPKTGDAANITAEISIDGGTSAATNDANPTELDAADHPGIYIFDLTQAEVNGDMIVITPVSATSDIVLEPLVIFTAPVPITAEDIADQVWDEAQSGHTTGGSFGEIATEIASILDDTDLIDDGTSGLAKIASDVADILEDTGTTLQGELDGIQSDTEDIQSRLPAALTGAGNIKADVLAIEGADPTDTINAQADQALADYDPPTKAELDTAESNIRGADSDTLKTLSDQIDTIDANAIADQVWDEARADHVGAGSFGEGVKTESLNTQAKADVNAEADTALTDYDPPTKAELDTAESNIRGGDSDDLKVISDQIDALNDLSAAEVNAEVDTALADYNGPTHAELISEIDDVQSDIAALNDLSDAEVWAYGTRSLTDKAGFSLSAAGIQAIWDALTSALTTAGSIGKLLVDNINATISSRASQTSVDTIDDFVDTEVAAIKAKTDNLPANPASATNVSDAQSAIQSDIAALPTAAENAVELLTTDVDTVEDTAAIHSLTNVILHFVSKVDAATGAVYKTDGVSLFATRTPTTDEDADPTVTLGVAS